MRIWIVLMTGQASVCCKHGAKLEFYAQFGNHQKLLLRRDR